MLSNPGEDSALPAIQRVAVFAPMYPPAFRGGGPIRSISALVREAPAHMEPIVLTADRDLGVRERLPVTSGEWSSVDGVPVYYASTDSMRKLLTALRSIRAAAPTLLHFNSFFNARLTILPLALLRLGYWPVRMAIISPRGEFGAGALSRHSMRKRLFILVFRMMRLDRRTIWHATADHERDDIRRTMGRRARVVVRHNDTSLPKQATPPPDKMTGPLRLVFLGRIVEHKGLAIALEALQPVTHPVVFDVYGAAEDAGYLEQCRRHAANLPENVTVTFHGPIEPERVRSALRDRDALVMPTAGENFGHVIAEALSVSCLVITTPDTPWGPVISSGGGVIVPDRKVDSWASALEDVASETPAMVHRRRIAAGESFERWASSPAPEHLWDLALQPTETGRAD